MTKNTLGDVHGLLMEQMNRVMDAEPGSDEMASEIERSRAVADLGKAVIANANTIMKAARMSEKSHADVPRMLTGGE